MQTSSVDPLRAHLNELENLFQRKPVNAKEDTFPLADPAMQKEKRILQALVRMNAISLFTIQAIARYLSSSYGSVLAVIRGRQLVTSSDLAVAEAARRLIESDRYNR